MIRIKKTPAVVKADALHVHSLPAYRAHEYLNVLSCIYMGVFNARSVCGMSQGINRSTGQRSPEQDKLGRKKIEP